MTPSLLLVNFDDDHSYLEDKDLKDEPEVQRGGHHHHHHHHPQQFYDDSGFEEVPLVGLDTFSVPPRRSSQKKQAKQLASIEEQAEQLRADSVASTRRMLEYCGQAEEAGIRTMEMLATQGKRGILGFLNS